MRPVSFSFGLLDLFLLMSLLKISVCIFSSALTPLALFGHTVRLNGQAASAEVTLHLLLGVDRTRVGLLAKCTAPWAVVFREQKEHSGTCD